MMNDFPTEYSLGTALFPGRFVTDPHGMMMAGPPIFQTPLSSEQDFKREISPISRNPGLQQSLKLIKLSEGIWTFWKLFQIC